MIYFPKGGNWQDWNGCSSSRNLELHINLKELMERLKEDRDGLPDRWLQIVEMKVRWGWTGYYSLHEPEAHCVKEGLWKW
jgi:hypothetical protein